MSEIENAIKEFYDAMAYGNWPSEAAVHLAIDALREQAERERGCAYCLEEEQRNSFGRIFYKEFPHDTNFLTSLDDAHLQLAFDSSCGWVLHFEDEAGDRMFDVKAKVCPNCGRRLDAGGVERL